MLGCGDGKNSKNMPTNWLGNKRRGGEVLRPAKWATRLLEKEGEEKKSWG